MLKTGVDVLEIFDLSQGQKFEKIIRFFTVGNEVWSDVVFVDTGLRREGLWFFTSGAGS